MKSPICSFSDDYAFLSNFYPSPIHVFGREEPTVEHAYLVATEKSPNWGSIKLGVMANLLRLKFAPGTRLASWLLATDDVFLVKGNEAGDRFWGVCGGSGTNHLGRLLMRVRGELGGVGLDEEEAHFLWGA